jgi:NADH dehydrogenase
MNLAITGGTGFVGRAIVRQAEAAGINVLHVPRPALSHPDLLPDILAGSNAVIHLVGIIAERGENTFERAHVETTRSILAGAAAAGIRRFIHMSALGTRPGARSRYHQTKWRAEEAVRASSLAWTIFRPSVIYGPEDKSINTLARMIRLAPFVPVLGSGKSLIQPVAVEVVAASFLAALRNDASAGKTYDLCGPTVVSWAELTDLLLQLTRRHKPKIHLPLPVARMLAGLPAAPFTRDQLLMLEEDNVGDREPAERDLLVEQEPLARGLARYVTP